jgi:hypothetical protein
MAEVKNIFTEKTPEITEPALGSNTPKVIPITPVPVADTQLVAPQFFKETHSTEIGSLAGALAKAQGTMINGAKAKAGYGYKYMELGSLIDIARPALSEAGICVIQTHELVKGPNPSVVTYTTLAHSSGQWHKSAIELPLKVMPQLTPAQMIGVNCTYGRRYALQAVCLIASEDDTDGSVKR